MSTSLKEKKEDKDQESIKAPHLTQNTNGKSGNVTLDITNESQEVNICILFYA